ARRPIAPDFCRGCEQYLSAGATAVEVLRGIGCALRAAASVSWSSPGPSWWSPSGTGSCSPFVNEWLR
ncbi:hypothetical protein ACTGQQ_001217, partial [Escherichia coli]